MAMVETSGFWTTSGSPSGHQVASYTQAHHSKALMLAAGAKGLDGVATSYLGGLEVTAGSGKVTVADGGGLVDGKWYEKTSTDDIAISSPTSGTERIDRVILKASWGTTYTVTCELKAGTASSSPTPPALTQTRGGIFEISLAQVRVTSAGVITVTDERYPAENTQTMPILAVGEVETLVASSSIPVRQIIIPEHWDGATLTNVSAGVFTVSSSGVVTVRVYNATLGQNVLSTNVTIDANERTSLTAATPPVVNATYATLTKGDLFQFFVETAGTGAKGLQVDLIALAKA
jgi:hypothetical protein